MGNRSPVVWSLVGAALLLLALLPAAAPARAASYSVTRFDDPAPGACTPADCSLREAIIAANASTGVPDTISLSPGVYTLSRQGSDDTAQLGDLDITHNSGGVSIYGSTFGAVVIDGGGIDRVFDICCQTNFVHIEKVTIRRGRLAAGQLGFYNHGHGAGIHNHGDLSLKDVTITDNAVDSTGGATPWGGGGLTNGCGLLATPTTATCPLHATGDAVLVNVTISGNQVIGDGKGGGIENGAVLSLTNVTVSANTAAAGKGGGLSNNTATADGFVALKHSIVAGNGGGDCLGAFASQGYNIAGDGSCGFANTGDRSATDPKLGALRDNGGPSVTHGLLQGSPALDGGINTGCPASDQRGVARPKDGNGNGAATCDIGAFEAEPTDVLISYMSDSPDPAPAGSDLIYTIDVRNGGAAFATGLTLVDTLPAGVTYASFADTRGGVCSHAGGTVTCRLDGLKPSFVWTVYLYVDVNPAATGTIINAASVSSAAHDPSPANNAMTESTAVQPAPTATLTVSRAGTGAGAVTSAPAGIDCGGDCAQSYIVGTVVTLTAAPAAGSIFAGWGGACAGAGGCAVTMTAARSVTATFTATGGPGPGPSPGPSPTVGATAWYFAEGYTGAGFDEYLTLQNPNGQAAQLQITYYLNGGAPVTKGLIVPANARATVAVHDPAQGVGRGKEVSAKVESTNGVGIVAERPIYFTYGAGITGGHNVMGVQSPRTSWLFAEGYTGAGFDEYLTILNPNPDPAPVTITYFLGGGQAPVVKTLAVPASARATVTVHDTAQGVGRNQEVSAKVETSLAAGIVVERPLYFAYTGSGGIGTVTGGHNVMGAAGPQPAWFFPEGNTAPGWDMYLTLMNVHPADSAVRLTYYVVGEATPRTRDIVAPRNSRTTVAVHEAAQGVGRGTMLGLKVETTNGVNLVAERPIYFRYSPTINGGHNAMGAGAAKARWLFAEGYTGAGFDEYLIVLNPNTTPAEVTITYYLNGGGAPLARTLTVAPSSRATVAVHDAGQVGRGREVSAKVETSHAGGVVAERPIYFRYLGTMDGGHTAIGHAAP